MAQTLCPQLLKSSKRSWIRVHIITFAQLLAPAEENSNTTPPNTLLGNKGSSRQQVMKPAGPELCFVRVSLLNATCARTGGEPLITGDGVSTQTSLQEQALRKYYSSSIMFAPRIYLSIIYCSQKPNSFLRCPNIATGLERYIRPDLTTSLVYFFYSLKPCVHAKFCPSFTAVALECDMHCY